MASPDALLNRSPHTQTGLRIRSKEDLNRVLIHIRKREEALKSFQKKLMFREKRLDEAERKLKKRNDFLDAWEVSLKSKEAEIAQEREELENIKRSLRKIGQELLALSEKTDSVFEGIPFDHGVVDDIELEQPIEEKKSFLGFLKRIPRKEKDQTTDHKTLAQRFPSQDSKGKRPDDREVLRKALMEKRDRLKGVSLDESQEPDSSPREVFACPMCGAEVNSGDEVCAGCGIQLNWGAQEF